MAHSKSFQTFVRSEHENDRLAALKLLAEESSSPMRDVSLFRSLLILPNRNEKSALAFHLRLSGNPTATWPLATILIDDSEQDVVGNAINSLTFSKSRALGHRLVQLFANPSKPQRILYCLARYAEEMTDRRLAGLVAENLRTDLSEAFAARSFNALFRLGICVPRAVEVAHDMVAAHITATNLDNKAAVSAILYLCFAGDREVIQRLKAIRDKVAIPELRRLLNWGLAEIDEVSAHGNDESDALKLLRKAARHNEPNFSGRGCFDSKTLLGALATFLSDTPPTQGTAATRIVLALGDAECIDLLASHPHFGLEKALQTENREILNLWNEFWPIHSTAFLKSIRSSENFAAWSSISPELPYISLEVGDLFGKRNNPWQKLFDKLLLSDTRAATELLCTQLLALERAFLAIPAGGPLTDQVADAAAHTLSNLEHLAVASAQRRDIPLQEVAEKVYSILIRGRFHQDFSTKIPHVLPPSLCRWAIPALSLAPFSHKAEHLNDLIQRSLKVIDTPIQDLDCDQEEYLIQVVTNLQAILTIGQQLGDKFLPETLHLAHLTSLKIQAILDALTDSGEHEDDDDEVADWAGHVAVDKPISRWDAVLHACFSPATAQGQLQEFETVLRESVRVAPHVEKRWVVRALARINSDDSVKAILYQAFQHVDQDFVVNTIRELLPSKHPRAQQALIRCVGRASVPDDVKLQILEEISLANPEEVLRELRTLEILRLPQDIDNAIRDTIGRIATLIDASGAREEITKVEGGSIVNVDHIITELLPSSDKLSVDTRSALRTAEMIFIQSHQWGTDAVDLSPIVNMHCKAVELAMRETLEPFTDALLRRGHLSRKLDLLGYARPIPEKMQVFEDHLASLPVIKTIPYFSRFKLRKMLRAICLYRPGKRFTLDGPKAFALLLLTTARKQCPFGLASLLDSGFSNDLELFEFIKLVHSLQDSRNRAVHEGLTWEAKDDIDSMRNQAYRIIEQTLRVGAHLKNHSTTGGDPAFERGA